MRYRLLNGIRTAPYYITQGTWDYLRKGLESQTGDVWITGYPGTGNILVQFMVRMILSGGEAETVTARHFELRGVAAMPSATLRSRLRGSDALGDATEPVARQRCPRRR